MSDRTDAPAQEFREIGGRFAAVVAGVRPDQWDDPSPVQEWAARDVVRHLVEWFPAFLASGAEVQLAAGPRADDDPAGAWHHLQLEVQALLDDPVSGDRVLSNPNIGSISLPLAVSRFFTADVFMHTWDLARATGQDDTLDSDRCAAMLSEMDQFEDAMRGSGQYGPRVEVPAEAGPQARMLGFIGRDPEWQPPASA